MKIQEIIAAIEDVAPVSLQESWDNSGLLIGNAMDEVNSALITLDVSEAVVNEAIQYGHQLIIAHHPLIFGSLKKLNGKTDAERAILMAVKHDVAIYAAHTNIDLAKNGVSQMMARKLSLQKLKPLVPQKGLLKKLVTFVPSAALDAVREAVSSAGAGQIGNYDFCSFSGDGTGTFRANELAHPFVGQKNEIHFEPEVRFETIFPSYAEARVLNALLKAHPYEEVAYDVYTLDNVHSQVGLGVIGELETPLHPEAVLKMVMEAFHCPVIRHTAFHTGLVSRVALVGGSGSTFLKDAIGAGADLFITADFKYHQFFDAENKIIIADIGHYESEQFTKELFYEIVTNKFSKFALRLSEVETNPIHYLF
ncbi:MAG: Nif3-like dinuclear metal center hexameric protein [Prolixibacteraceae bacterium]|nr:Nif3-like dinuclear metal center hexameric protein [Prolixibacteraceae bacterium]